ncbi:hypothetical protein ACIRPX_21145 [Streptomyces sp. NPDC101225]|uniref:hypothetical protein n=1 Tax=Streptomyces sp. NPDC101225 TaxID=3366135 RepID=UPI003808FD07
MIPSALRRHRAASVTAVALAVVLLAAGVTELAARTLLHSRLAAAADRALGKGSEVDVDGGSAVVELLHRHLDSVAIGNDHATLGRIPDVSVHARLTDVRLAGERSATVARTHADVEIPATSLQSMTSDRDSRLPVTAVRFDDEADTITLELGEGGLGRVTVQPRLQDGRVALHLDSAEILGRAAPARLVDRIQAGLTQRTDAAYPLGLKATTVDVTATNLSVGLDGGPTSLPGKEKR